jgi:hypothetical protein
MSQLSKTAESKLLTAIETAAEYVNTGLSPNDAIIKSATQYNIPPGHLDLMVHAYNTGRTTTQRERGESTIEKAANFDMADIDVIKKTMFSPTVKTSAEIANNAAVSMDYAVPPVGWLNRMAKKNAAMRTELIAATTRVKVAQENSLVPSLYAQKMAERRAAEENRRNVTDLYYKTSSKFEELATYFKTAGHVPYADVLEDVAITHGEHGALVLKKLAGLYPEIEKERATGAPVLADTKPRQLVEEVLNCVDEYNKAASAFYAADAKSIGPTYDSFVNDKPVAPRNSILPDIASPHVQKIAGEQNVPATRERRPASFSKGVVPPDATLNSMLIKAAASTARVFERDPTAPFDSPGGYRTYVLDQDGNAVDMLGDLEPARVDQPRTSTTRVWREGRDGQPGGHQSILIDSATGNQLATLGDVEPAREQGGGGHGVNPFDVGSNVGSSIGQGMSAMNPVNFVGRVAETMGKAEMPDSKAVAAKTLASISGTEQDKALRDIKSRSVMHDLIMNDPVISAHEPQEVAMAFNEIAELAPSMVDSPGMLRVVLRKRLEAGQLADFDVKQIMEMDKLRAERDKIVNETRRLNKESL